MSQARVLGIVGLAALAAAAVAYAQTTVTPVPENAPVQAAPLTDAGLPLVFGLLVVWHEFVTALALAVACRPPGQRLMLTGLVWLTLRAGLVALAVGLGGWALWRLLLLDARAPLSLVILGVTTVAAQFPVTSAASAEKATRAAKAATSERRDRGRSIIATWPSRRLPRRRWPTRRSACSEL